MRVALISPLFESVPPKLYGGTERVVYNLCRGLTEANIEVTVFASGDSSVDGKLIAVTEEALRLRKIPAIDSNAFNFKMLQDVKRQAEDFDVIHNHHDYWMLPLSEMTATPVVTTMHGRLDIPESMDAFRSFPRASFISISDSQRKPLAELNFLRTIHHGLDLNDFEFYEKPGKYLAFLGRISAEKRPEYAIEIAKKSGVPLKIAAKIEGPVMQQYYDAFVKPHVDGKFIEFVGEISEHEKSEFLGNALAMAFPIDWPEPFGLVLIESLACGTPVLTREQGAAPELMQDGVTGYCTNNVDELARRVQDIHKIDRKGCRRWVEEKFSLKRMTEDYIHVYQHLSDFSSVRTRTGKAQGAYRYRRDFLHSVERLADRNS